MLPIFMIKFPFLPVMMWVNLIAIILILQNFLKTSLLIQWALFQKLNTKMVFFLDSISIIFIFTVALITLSVLIFSKSYMNKDKINKKFYFLLILFVFSMFLLVLSPNNLSMLLGWDGLGLSSYLLVIYYNSNKSNSSGLITLLINRFGDALILTALFLQIKSHSWSTPETFNSPQIKSFALLFSLGLMTKSAQIPFSSWLPAAMAAPTPVSSLVHSSTLVTAGIYLMIRLNNLYKKVNLENPLIMLGSMTALMASLLALKENDMKKVVALSTLSQLGFMVTMIGLNCWFLAFTHLVNHAFFKALLFISTGNMIHSSNDSQDLKITGQKANQMFNSFMVVTLATMSMTGITFLTAFYAKEIMLENMFLTNKSLLISLIFFINLFLTPIYAIRSTIIFYFLTIKQFSKTYTENNDTLVNWSMLLLILPTFLSGFAINKSFYFKEQTSASPLLYIALALSMIILTFNLMYFLKFKHFFKLFTKKAFSMTMWGTNLIYFKWTPTLASVTPQKITTEEKKFLTQIFNIIFHELTFNGQTNKIYLNYMLILIAFSLLTTLLYYLNNKKMMNLL